MHYKVAIFCANIEERNQKPPVISSGFLFLLLQGLKDIWYPDTDKDLDFISSFVQLKYLLELIKICDFISNLLINNLLT